MAYASSSDVSALCRNLIGKEKTFTLSTSPNSKEVDAWLSSGCAIIETSLEGCRYSMPATAGTQIYDQLKQLNAVYAAGWAEMSRTNVTLEPGERTRGQVFLEFFDARLEKLCNTDLTGVGLSRRSAGKLYAGGISISDKQLNEADTDRTAPRFSRDMFTFPDVVDPQATTAS